MPTIRKIKALVADRKVGYFIVPYRQRQCQPVVEGGILDLVMNQLPLRTGDGTMTDLTTPSF
jgi:hypothetical protein